jgi:hypothetical protein
MFALAAALFPALLALAPQDPGTPAEPPHVEWQRSLTDALAVQKATGLPLLIAVNMDGEVFNERFANNTYKDPTFVESTRGWVCVVASPDRHTERDYDAFGNRIECPRFPGCTCSEHIAIEPQLFARWFNGTRNAPRHVGVSTDGKVLFDRFLDQSMQTAIDAIGKHRGTPKADALAPTTDLAVLFGRRDAFARRLVEGLWRRSDLAEKKRLLAAATTATNEPIDLLRAALRSEDPAAFALAALATGKHASKATLIDLEDALARCDDPGLVRDLVARLQELGKDVPEAARLHAHFAAAGKAVTVAKPWSNPWAKARFAADDRAAIEAELDACEAALKQNPNDATFRLRHATACLALGTVLANSGQKGAELWFGDATTGARKVTDQALAEEAQAVVACASWLNGDSAAAARALALAQTPTESTRQPDPFLAGAVLELIAQALPAAVFADAEAAQQKNLRGDVDQVRAALDLAQERHVATERGQLAGIGLLEFAALRRDARERLARVVAAFPTSAAAHERWRNRIAVDLGWTAVTRALAEHVGQAQDKPTAEWFAGYGCLLAAEQHTRDALPDRGLTAYADAIDHLQRSAAGNADFADSAHHYLVLALGGRAELLLGRGHAEDAAADLLRAADLRAASLDENDGLQRKPRAIAGRVHQALTAAGHTDLAGKLQQLLPQ